MKVAIVHDYIKEFGGAERVLLTLTEMYPKAPIYTAFRVRGSTADRQLKGKKVIESWLAPILKLWRLYSPLRFLIPVIWGSFDLTDYDLVIVSCSWYVTRGFKVGDKTTVIAYCHTPPRWLYGYETSVGFTKYWPVKVYALLVGHFMRLYDYKTAQDVDYFVANSKNVKDRIKKFYRRDAKVIYPPVNVREIANAADKLEKQSFYLMASRLVGAKGLENVAKFAKSLGINLKIVGESHGFSDVEAKIKNLKNVEMLGRVSDRELYKLLGQARGFIALARDEDFGMTVVEAQAAGTPVIAYKGGGFKESVVDGTTGIFVEKTDKDSLKIAIRRLEKTSWDKRVIVKNAMKFSKEKFKREMLQFVNKYAQKKKS